MGHEPVTTQRPDVRWREWVGPAFVLLFLVVALAYLWESRSQPHRLLPVADALLYLDTAREAGSVGGLADHGDFPLSRLYLLGLTFLLRVVDLLGVGSSSAVRPDEFVGLAHLFVVAGGVAAVLWVTRRISSLATLVAGVLLVAFGPLYFFVGVPVPVAPAVGLSAISLALLVHALADGSRWALYGSAALLGCLVDLRPHFVALVPVLVLLALLASRAWGPRRWIEGGGVFGAIILPLLLVGLVFDAGVEEGGGDRLPVRSSVGMNLYIGNQPEGRGLYRPLPGIDNRPRHFQESAARYVESELGRSAGALDQNLFWVRRTVDHWVQQPGSLFSGMRWKAWNVLAPQAFPLNYDYEALKRFSWILPALVVNLGIVVALALVEALYLLLGLQERRTRDRRGGTGDDGDGTRLGIRGITALWFLGYLTTLFVFFVALDHRMPLVVPGAVLAGGLAERIRGLWSRGRIRRLGALGMMAVGLVAIGVQNPVEWSHHVTYQQMGEMGLELGRSDLAAGAFFAAAREDPTFVPAAVQLGEHFRRRGDHRNAIRWYSRATGLAPDERQYREALAHSVMCLGAYETVFDMVERYDLDLSSILARPCG